MKLWVEKKQVVTDVDQVAHLKRGLWELGQSSS